MEDKVVVKTPPKSPAAAGILSGIFPGTGFLYLGQYLKGLVYILVFAGLVTMQGSGRMQPFLGLCLAGFYIFQIIDAIQAAKIVNRKAVAASSDAAELTPAEELSGDIRTGSVFWGMFLLGLGALFLLANFDVIDYGSVWKYWPVLIIVIGVKLVIEHVVAAKTKDEN
jgi:TM2 domain-containing membrane protein YozV